MTKALSEWASWLLKLNRRRWPLRLPSFDSLIAIQKKLEREAIAKKIKTEIFATFLDLRKILLKYGRPMDDDAQAEIFLFSVSLAVISISRSSICYAQKKRLLSSLFRTIAADFEDEARLLLGFLDSRLDIYTTWYSAGPTILTSMFADRMGFDLDEREFFDIRAMTTLSGNRLDDRVTL